MLVPKELLSTVSFLYIKDENGYRVVGTAFHLLIVEEKYTFTYIVTCKHVIENAEIAGKSIFLRLNRSDDINVDYARIESDWVYHHRAEVDLAIALLVPDGRPLELSAFGIENIMTRREQKGIGLSEVLGVEVCFIGLFHQYVGIRRNYPIVRHGRIALITDESVYGHYGTGDYHIIECQAQPGNSGSPVLLPLKKQNETATQWRIMGVIQAHLIQPTEFSIAPISDQTDKETAIKGYFEAHSGISLATPAEYIIDILNSEFFIEQRRKRFGAGKLE